jgi:hypothetical protein
MVSGIDPVVGPGDLSLFVDQKAHPTWPGCLGILAGAVCECDGPIEVAEERKVEGIFLRERGIGFHAVEADPQDLDIVFIVVVLMVAEPAALGGSARGVCCGIKPQQHLPTPQIGQCDGATVVRGQCKISSPITRVEHLHILPVGRYGGQLSIARKRASNCRLVRSLGSISRARSNSAAAAVIIPLATYTRPRFK